jgi:hypothetical protein
MRKYRRFVLAWSPTRQRTFALSVDLYVFIEMKYDVEYMPNLHQNKQSEAEDSKPQI